MWFIMSIIRSNPSRTGLSRGPFTYLLVKCFLVRAQRGLSSGRLMLVRIDYAQHMAVHFRLINLFLNTRVDYDLCSINAQ